MLVFTLSGESRVDPILLSGGIVPHIDVAQCRQFTGGILRSISSWLCAVDHNVSCFIRQKCGC